MHEHGRGSIIASKTGSMLALEDECACCASPSLAHAAYERLFWRACPITPALTRAALLPTRLL